MVYGASLDDETFVEKVGNLSIKRLTQTARERRSGSMGFAEAMIIEYNGKKKSHAGKLLINKLYAKDSTIFDILEENKEEDIFNQEENDETLRETPVGWFPCEKFDEDV